MKYPQEQYETTLKAAREIARVIDAANMNPHQLHFMIYQQFNEGQDHNKIVRDLDGNWKRKGNAIKVVERLIDFECPGFKLYPEGCNDSHIETAMKRVQKELKK